jgi:hypothetical protein
VIIIPSFSFLIVPQERGCRAGCDPSSDADCSDSFVHSCKLPCVGVLDPAWAAVDTDPMTLQRIADAGVRCFHRPPPFSFVDGSRRELRAAMGRVCVQVHRSRLLCRRGAGRSRTSQGNPQTESAPVVVVRRKKKAASRAAPRERYVRVDETRWSSPRCSEEPC